MTTLTFCNCKKKTKKKTRIVLLSNKRKKTCFQKKDMNFWYLCLNDFFQWPNNIFFQMPHHKLPTAYKFFHLSHSHREQQQSENNVWSSSLSHKHKFEMQVGLHLLATHAQISLKQLDHHRVHVTMTLNAEDV